MTEYSHFQDEGKRGFWDPETLFSRIWGFGPLSGVGGIPNVAAILSLASGELSCDQIVKEAHEP